MEAHQWDAEISSLPDPHILQSFEWGQVKARFGWQPSYKLWRGEAGQPSAAALVLQRTLPLAGSALKLHVLYVPKGPLLDWRDEGLRRQILSDLTALARQRRAIFVKIDPDIPVESSTPGSTGDLDGARVVSELQSSGWRYSNEQIQFRNTVLLDLSPGEEELLAKMKQKTRYNIRLAERKGVKVRPGGEADLDILYRMYAETSVRDNFVIREPDYYRSVWKCFIEAGLAEPLIAEYEGQPLAALIVFHFGKKAWYLYGMSRDRHRELMPNYLLQWEAIRRAKAAGCLQYDLWGAPDELNENDPMWGVYRFKEGLGGRLVRHIGAWDYPANPLMYRLYTQTLPRLLELMRRRGKAAVRGLVGQ